MSSALGTDPSCLLPTVSRDGVGSSVHPTALGPLLAPELFARMTRFRLLFCDKRNFTSLSIHFPTDRKSVV